MGRKATTEEDAKQWLKENRPDIELIEWGGKTSARSTFLDTSRNVEFECKFSDLKSRIKKRPNSTFGATKDEWLQKFRQTNLQKYGVEYPLQNEEVREKWKKNKPWKMGGWKPIPKRRSKRKKKTNKSRTGSLDWDRWQAYL